MTAIRDVKTYQAAYCKANKEKIKSLRRRYYENNKAKELKQMTNWVSANKDKSLAIKRKYAFKNYEKERIRKAIYKKLNPHKVRFDSMKRIVAKLRRTPKWLTEGDWIEIKWAYKIATDMTSSTGVKYEVDHIIPLQGKNVSGLHMPSNLKVITKKANGSKSNKWEI